MMRGRVSWLMVGVVLTVLVSGLVGRNIWTGAQQQEIEVCPSYQGSCPYT
jgi:cell division protein FtsN